MNSLKFYIVLTTIGIMTLVLFASQEDQYEQAFRRTQVEKYRNILEQFDIDGSATGARDYLMQFLPNEALDKKILSQIQLLKDKKFKARVAAESSLSSLGPAAVRFLNDAASNSDPETQMRARRALKTINSKTLTLTNAAINLLRFDETVDLESKLDMFFALSRSRLTGDFDDELSNAVLHCAQPSVRQKIINGTQDENRLIRTTCVRALSRCLQRHELDNYRDLLFSSDAYVSIAAIESFGFVAPTESVQQTVESLLHSDDTSIRRSAVNFLRAISKTHMGFDFDAGEQERDAAAAKWQAWLIDNRPITETSFQRMLARNNQQPIGLLITVSSQGVRRYDLQGNLEWKLQGQAYDAQHVNQNASLITFRSVGEVKLFRKDKLIRTVEGLNSPSDAEYLENGNVLVANGDGTITEHDESGKIVNRFDGFRNPFDVDRLENGNTLIADSSNNRIVEVDSTGLVLWTCENLRFPNNVFRLPDGRTLYTTYTSGLVGIVGLDGTKLWEKKIGGYTSGLVGIVGLDGTKLWEKKIGGATLYSVYCARGKIYVADGANRKVWIMDMAGEIVGEIAVPESFCDVGFITR